MQPFLVLLDRDGTLIEDKDYLADPAGVVLLPGVVDGLRRLQAAGANLVVVSNQSGVGRGYFTARDVEAVHRRLAALLAEDGVMLEKFIFCPHTPDDHCRCRKPAAGMLEQAAAATGLPLADAIVVGDKASDIEAGKVAGCATVLLRTPTNTGRETPSPEVSADVVVSKMPEVAEWILARKAGGR